MKSFLGKFVRYFLWLCLFVLLGAFLLGLLLFKGNVSTYVKYLNSVNISQLFSSGSLAQNYVSQTGVSLSGATSGEFEGEFLPEPGTLDESDFGFSGSLDVSGSLDDSGVNTPKVLVGTGQSGSVSAETLIDLVKSKEK